MLTKMIHKYTTFIFRPYGYYWPFGFSHLVKIFGHPVFIDSAVQIRPYEPTSIKVFTINPATLLATLAFDQQTTIISIFVNFSKFLKINVKSVKFSTSKYVKFTQTLH